MLFTLSVLTVSVILDGIFGLLGGAVGTGVGLYLLNGGITYLNRSWKLSTASLLPIDEAIATDELVQVSGSVRASQLGDTILSPIQNEECVAYTYEISSQLNENRSIDSGADCRPFRLSDGTAEILVEPIQEGLSLDTHTQTVTGGKAVSDEINTEKTDVGLSTEISDPDGIPNNIGLTEGTIAVGEEITAVGHAIPASQGVTADTDVGATVDAGAVMTPETGHLNLRNTVSKTTALKTGARGAVALIFGSVFTLIGVGVFLSTLSSLLS